MKSSNRHSNLIIIRYQAFSMTFRFLEGLSSLIFRNIFVKFVIICFLNVGNSRCSQIRLSTTRFRKSDFENKCAKIILCRLMEFVDLFLTKK